MKAFYNEIDPYCCAWLSNLMDAGHITPGVICDRSIEDISPKSLLQYDRVHMFAGIAGWELALKHAGWGNRRVWTGSCPCQPFSAAGKGAGFDDQRHLWPAWFHLIRECRPAVVFGEQVASKDAEPWVDLVHADLETVGYAFGCVPFPAAGIGAPHIRDRNYWCGVGLADTDHARLEGRQGTGERAAERPAWPRGVAGGVADALPAGRSEWRPSTGEGPAAGSGGALRLGYAIGAAGERLSGSVFAAKTQVDCQGRADGRLDFRPEHAGASVAARPGPLHGFWRAADWLLCRDGRWRPVEPGTQPLAHGIPGRVGRLRAYGNAIVPQEAAEFVASFLDIEQQRVMEAAA